MTGPDFGDRVTGAVADEDDWTARGPRVKRPRRVVTGTVTGIFADAPNAARVTVDGTGETVCVRITGRG